jgi:hypothetical protein
LLLLLLGLLVLRGRLAWRETAPEERRLLRGALGRAKSAAKARLGWLLWLLLLLLAEQAASRVLG